MTTKNCCECPNTKPFADIITRAMWAYANWGTLSVINGIARGGSRVTSILCYTAALSCIGQHEGNLYFLEGNYVTVERHICQIAVPYRQTYLNHNFICTKIWLPHCNVLKSEARICWNPSHSWKTVFASIIDEGRTQRKRCKSYGLRKIDNVPVKTGRENARVTLIQCCKHLIKLE